MGADHPAPAPPGTSAVERLLAERPLPTTGSGGRAPRAALWICQAAVGDCAAAAVNAAALGGTVLAVPEERGGAVTALLQDPQGAVFGVVQLPG